MCPVTALCMRLPCVCVCLLHYIIPYIILGNVHTGASHTNNATYTHAQGSDRTRWSQKVTLWAKEIGLLRVTTMSDHVVTMSLATKCLVTTLTYTHPNGCQVIHVSDVVTASLFMEVSVNVRIKKIKEVVPFLVVHQRFLLPINWRNPKQLFLRPMKWSECWSSSQFMNNKLLRFD